MSKTGKETTTPKTRNIKRLLKRFEYLEHYTGYRHLVNFVRWCRKRWRKTLGIPHIASIEETVAELLNTERSLARFGDGEYFFMFLGREIGFQKSDALLAERLKEVLASRDPNLMIALTDVFGVRIGRSFRPYKSELRKQIGARLDPKIQYYKTNVTRIVSWEQIRKLKKIWEGKKVVTIEGSMCRLGVGNDLFDNVESLHRILAPAECAFSEYDRILEEALKIEKDALFLIALGPTATVLAHDLCQAGYRALDIGHLDICYELFLRNEPHMVAIEGKYVNEASYRYPVPCTDPVYLAQIIMEIKLNGSPR